VRPFAGHPGSVMSDDFPVLALVCSVGGLDALIQVLEPLPAGLPAAVIVLQHLEPERTSHLPAILGARTALPAAFAVEDEPLVPGRIVVAPAGQHTLITARQRLALIPSGSLPPYRPSADLLLTTLAIAVGARLTAVVLSGNGNDAATGATAVSHFGGTVIASTPATSAAPAMPGATIDRDHAVDHVVPLDDLAALLIAMVHTPRLPVA
jgi:two-component system, chemotaxis family, protein-glutamate methylesterase/glutaminase